MLKLFRKKIVMKVVLWGLVIIVALAFTLMGSPSLSGGKNKGPNYVGLVDNKKVSFDDLSNAFLGVRSQIILNYFNQPKVLEALLSNKPILAKLAWDRILMMNEVKKAGIKISDKEVIESLRSHPLFTRNGTFDDRFYAYILRNNIGLEARDFEEIVRENLALQKLSASLTKDVKVSDEDVLAEYKKELGKIKISYVLLEPKEYLEKAVVDEKAVKDFYDKNRAEFTTKLDPKNPASVRQATFEEAKADIEKYFKELEARKMLKEKSDEIYKDLLERIDSKKETFAKAASKLGLTVKDTDFFSKKDNVEAIGDVPYIVEVARELKDLELSKPLDINKGYIIFEVTGRKDADEEAFAKDKEEFSKKMRDAKANIVMEKWLKDLENKAKLVIKLEDMEKHYQ